MKKVISNELTAVQTEEINRLVHLCKEAETLYGTPFISDDLNYDITIPCFFMLYIGEELVSFLSLFLPDSEEAEIYGYTHPSHRKKGYFSILLDEACKVLLDYDILDVVFVHEPSGEDANKYLDSLPVWHAYSEYILRHSSPVTPLESDEYSLVEADSSDLDIISFIHADAFNMDIEHAKLMTTDSITDENIKTYRFMRKGSEIGVCNAYISAERITIFGLCILHKYQGLGYGKTMVTMLLNRLQKYNKDIILEVSGTNTAAINLYEKTGFTILSQFDYAAASCEDLIDYLEK